MSDGKRSRITIGTLLLVVMLGSFAAGCAPAAPAPAAGNAPAVAAPAAAAPTAAAAAAEPAAAGAAKRGGILKWAVGAAPENMDAVWSEANQDIWVAVNVFEGLVRVTPDGLDIEPALADKWTISPDGLVYTFHMRQGVTFHDGTPVTAGDAVFSLQRAQNEGPWSWSLAGVDTIEADGENVKITLKEQSSEFLSDMALFSNEIVPQKAVEAAGKDGDTYNFFKKPIGTGPFMVTDWVVGDYMTLKKNPNYWEMGADGQPLPYLDGVEIKQVAEDTTRTLQVQSGDQDGTYGVPFSQIAGLKSDPKATVTLWPSTQSYWLELNHRIPPLDDVKVRQAMNYALDKQAMLNAVLSGNGELATSIFPKGSPCWNPNLTGFPYDLEKAKQLMKESKYPDGFSGIHIQVPAGRVIGRDQATMAKDMWAKIGINVEIQEMEGGLLSQLNTNNQEEIISGYQWTNDINDNGELAGWAMVDPAMHSGWSNPTVLDLAAKAKVELDPAKRCDMYYQMQQLFNDDAVAILLYHTPFVTFVNNNVKGFYMIPLGWYVWKGTWLSQ